MIRSPLLKLLLKLLFCREPHKRSSRNPHRGSSQSNGAVEIAVQQAETQIRALRLALEENYGASIPLDHPIMGWLCLHAGFCHNRFQIGHDGHTPYRRNKGKDFDKALLEFGECVHYKIVNLQDPDSIHKYDARWSMGIFLGLRPRSNEIYVGTPDGVQRCRTIHRKPQPERFDPQYLQFKGTPWNHDGGDWDAERGGDVEPAVILPARSPASDLPAPA